MDNQIFMYNLYDLTIKFYDIKYDNLINIVILLKLIFIYIASPK